MKIEYYRWHSPNLHHDMELKVYGYYGKPVLVFPAQAGKFYDFENFGMVDAVSGFIESGKIKLFCVDSIDHQSWANFNIHPADRARRHEDYDRYITDEVAPFIKSNCANSDEKVTTTGCSMGGYHAGNFFFRHPEIFDGVISLSGLFLLRIFVGDFVDDLVYFNSPLLFLPGLNDPYYLDLYRRSQIIICAGQGAWEDEMVADAKAMQSMLAQKNIPAWIDLWGSDVNHDWFWWRKQLPFFLSKIVQD